MYRITDDEIRTVQNATGLSEEQAVIALQKCKGNVWMTISTIPNIMRGINKDKEEYFT